MEKYGIRWASRKYDRVRSYFYSWNARWVGVWSPWPASPGPPYNHPRQYTDAELKPIRDMNSTGRRAIQSDGPTCSPAHIQIPRSLPHDGTRPKVPTLTSSGGTPSISCTPAQARTWRGEVCPPRGSSSS